MSTKRSIKWNSQDSHYSAREGLSNTIILGADVEDQATGCNASSYREYAADLGYQFIEVLNWCSSAGDWEFLVSKDGEEWRILTQTNNWPRPGFSYTLSKKTFYGTAEKATQTVIDMFY